MASDFRRPFCITMRVYFGALFLAAVALVWWVY